MDELERILAFLRAVDEGASTSTKRFEFGVGYFHADLPRVYDRNFLLVTEPDVDAKALVRDADRLQGGAGLSHRKVVFETEQGAERVASLLGDAGWEQRRLVIMAHSRGAGDDSYSKRGKQASEVDRRALLPALETIIETEPWGTDPEVVRQLSGADAAIERAIEQRCFARLVGGAVVSSCRLYSDGTTAQIEDVATVPGHRQRGYAGAVVARAASEALAKHDLVFLTAVDGRWVKCWYERLGFRQIGLRHEATRSA